MSHSHLVRYRLEAFAVHVLALVFRAVPRRLAQMFGAGLGLAACSVFRVRRSVVDKNLEIAFGSTTTREQRNRIARRCYIHFGVVSADALRLLGRKIEAWESLIESIEGEQYLRGDGHSKPGVGVVVTAHFGFWELAGPVMTARGFKAAVVAKPMHNPFIERLVLKGRNHENFALASTRESMKPLVKYVRDGWFLAFLADQDARRTGLFVDFLGRAASTPAGPAYFAVRMGLPLVPCFVTRTENGSYRVEFEEPITPPEGVEMNEAIEALTRAHVQRLEKRIREHPEQYWWFHRRWKTRPREAVTTQGKI
jgi:Kdo2-lipid IVA lauroyltransferase/acyltransferase